MLFLHCSLGILNLLILCYSNWKCAGDALINFHNKILQVLHMTSWENVEANYTINSSKYTQDIGAKIWKGDVKKKKKKLSSTTLD